MDLTCHTLSKEASIEAAVMFAVLVLDLCSRLTGELMALSYHVLLCDVALHVAVGVFVLEELGEGGVLGVSIQSHHVVIVAAQLGQSHAIRLPRGNLVTQGQTHDRSVNQNRYKTDLRT